MDPLLRAVLPQVIGALALALLAGTVLWYGHTQRAAGVAECQKAHRVAGLKELKTEVERLTDLSQSLADTGQARHRKIQGH
jgi:hypothetical protein